MRFVLLSIFLSLALFLAPAHAIVAPKVTLNWTQSSSPNLADNCIYRGLVQGGPYVQIACTPSPVITYPDSTVVRGTVYYYVVTAVDNNSIESPFSNEIKAIVPGINPPTGLTAIIQ